MVSKMRAQRIAERVYEELSQLLIHDVQDPRLSGVYITGVKIDRELAFADIYVSATEGSQRADEIIQGFEHASGFFRSELASRVNLRIFPQLRFHWDPTPERAAHIEELIASLHEDSPPGTVEETGSVEEEGGEDG
jgi:ribosome-binding factor A